MLDRLNADLRASMKARDTVRTSTLRLLLTALKNAQVEKRGMLGDDEITDVISREAKRRREAIDAYAEAGREDRAETERAELSVLEAYLPERLGEDELDALIEEAIAEAGDQPQMGAVMKVLMPKVKGRADGAAVSAAVRARLGG